MLELTCHYDERYNLWVCTDKDNKYVGTGYDKETALSDAKIKYITYGKDLVQSRTDYDEINE